MTAPHHHDKAIHADNVLRLHRDAYTLVLHCPRRCPPYTLSRLHTPVHSSPTLSLPPIRRPDISRMRNRYVDHMRRLDDRMIAAHICHLSPCRALSKRIAPYRRMMCLRRSLSPHRTSLHRVQRPLRASCRDPHEPLYLQQPLGVGQSHNATLPLRTADSDIGHHGTHLIQRSHSASSKYNRVPLLFLERNTLQRQAGTQVWSTLRPGLAASG